MLRGPGTVAAVVLATIGLLGACSGSGDTANPPGASAPTLPATTSSTTNTTTTTSTPDATPSTTLSEGDLGVTRDPFTPQG